MHPTNHRPGPRFVTHLSHEAKAELIRDIYGKHVAELLAIEDSQQKLVLLLLSVFGAGASFLASDNANFSLTSKLGLTIVVLGMIAVSWRYTRRRDGARISVRQLMVQCEKALGLYEPDLFLTSGSLYKPELANFPKWGDWMSRTFWLASLAAAGFLFILWTSGS